MRYWFFPTIVILLFNGCMVNSEGALQEGDTKKTVIDIYGLPDVISEQSGDLIRWYIGQLIPDVEWPKSSIQKFYYLETKTVITLQNKKVLSIVELSETDEWMIQRTIRLAKEGHGLEGKMIE